MKSESKTIGWRRGRVPGGLLHIGCQGRPEASTFTTMPEWHVVHRPHALWEGRARENSLWMAAPGMLEELKAKSMRQGHTGKQGGVEQGELQVDGKSNVKSLSKESGIRLWGNKNSIQHFKQHDIIYASENHSNFVCMDCRVARKGGSPVDVVKYSWERRCWSGPSRGARETWTGGQYVWDNRAFACLLLSSFPFLLTFVAFSTFRKSQDHAPKSKGPLLEN